MRVLSLAILLLILAITGRAQDSPHGSDFKINCKDCHSARGWEVDRKIYSFDHNSTRLPLEGQHFAVNCKSCHPTLIFSEANTECFSCHTDMHNQTVGMECGRCHTPKSWIVENITDLHRQSRFPLQGPHSLANCMDCHQSASLLQFEPLGVECFDCHMPDYQSTSNPNHVLGNISINCADCHSITAFSWGGAGFNHGIFPLTEGHAVIDCNQCHAGTDYSNISGECFSCHQIDFNATINPSHLRADLSTNCLECHTTQPGWKPAQFDHSFFSLTQGHALIDCNQCHDVGNYSNISTDCFSCHQTDYDATANPDHLSAGISNVCMECHTTMPGWKPAAYEHLTFPLTLGHALNDCNQCHEDGNYSNISPDCVSCHQPDYNATTNPNHITAGIPDVCMDCHTTMPGWKPATFDHTSFPLTLGHNITNCNQCHEDGNYSNISTDCVSCHQIDYNATTNPNHTAAGISDVCLECHTTMPGWKPAEFAIHDAQFFPIFSGAHNGEWTSCTECHSNPANYSVFTCIDCHEHNRTDMDDKHSGENDYEYSSLACLDCHPTGRHE